MKFVKVLFLIILCLVVLVSVLVLQGALVVNKTVLSTTFWDTKILDPVVNSIMPLLEGQLTSGLGELADTEAFASGLTAALSPDFVKSSASDVVGRVIGFIKGKYEDPFATIDLSERKQVFADTVMSHLSEAEINGLRQQHKIAPDASDQEAILSFLPIPDDFSIAKSARAHMGEDLNHLLTTAGAARGYVAGAMLVGIVVFIVILLLIWALAGLPGALKWTGSTLIIGGGFFLAFSQATTIMRFLPASQLPEGVSNYISVETLAQTVGGGLSQVSTPITAGFIGAGVFLVVLGFVLSSRKKTASQV